MTIDDARMRKTWNPWAGIPAVYNLGVDLTIGQVHRGRGGKPALLWENAAGQTRAYTYAQLDALSSRFADSLQRLGVRRGDRVFLRLPSRPEFYVAALGAAKLGAVFIPTSPQFRESEIRYRLQDSEAVVAVSTPRLVEAIERVRADCPSLQNVIVVEDEKVMSTFILNSLRRIGILDLYVCPDGASALREVIRLKPDLILTDVHMQPVGGIEFVLGRFLTKDGDSGFKFWWLNVGN